MTTALDIVQGALDELSWRAPDDPLPADEAGPALKRFNAMLRSLARSGIILNWPTGKTSRGRWRPGMSYAVDDAVYLNGVVYVCTVAHSSPGPVDATSKPGSGPTWASYWSRHTPTDLLLTDSITIDAGLEEGLISMLAERLGPSYGQSVSAETHRQARLGFAQLWATYNPDNDQELDPALTTPSSSPRRWW